MVGKLIKHQLREEAKVLGMAICGLLLLCGGLFALRHAIGPAVYVVLSAMLVLLASGIVLLSMCYIGIRFYKTMYGNEGYLTQTLPIPEKTVMRVKYAVGFCEMLIANAAVIPALLVMFNAVGITAAEVYSVVPQLMDPILYLMFNIVMVLQVAVQISMIYLAVTFAGSKYMNGGPIMSLAAYAVLYIGMQAVNVLATLLIPFCMVVTSDGIRLSASFMLADIIANPNAASIGLGSIIMYPLLAVCGFILASRLNRRYAIVR